MLPKFTDPKSIQDFLDGLAYNITDWMLCPYDVVRNYGSKYLSDPDVAYIGADLDGTIHCPIVSRKRLKSPPAAPQYLIDACFLGANHARLYKKG